MGSAGRSIFDFGEEFPLLSFFFWNLFPAAEPLVGGPIFGQNPMFNDQRPPPPGSGQRAPGIFLQRTGQFLSNGMLWNERRGPSLVSLPSHLTPSRKSHVTHLKVPYPLLPAAKQVCRRLACTLGLGFSSCTRTPVDPPPSEGPFHLPTSPVRYQVIHTYHPFSSITLTPSQIVPLLSNDWACATIIPGKMGICKRMIENGDSRSKTPKNCQHLPKNSQNG